MNKLQTPLDKCLKMSVEFTRWVKESVNIDSIPEPPFNRAAFLFPPASSDMPDGVHQIGAANALVRFSVGAAYQIRAIRPIIVSPWVLSPSAGANL